MALIEGPSHQLVSAEVDDTLPRMSSTVTLDDPPTGPILTPSTLSSRKQENDLVVEFAFAVLGNLCRKPRDAGAL
jgi:hypothetical protein